MANRHPAPELETFALRLPQRLITEQIVSARHSDRWPEERPLPDAFDDSAGYHVPSPFRNEWLAHCRTCRLRMTGYDFRWYARWVLGLGIGSFTPAIKVQRQARALLDRTDEVFGSGDERHRWRRDAPLDLRW